MKIQTKNKCFIQLEDLLFFQRLNIDVPTSINKLYEVYKDYTNLDFFIKIDNPEAKNFIDNTDFIVSFDDNKTKSYEELLLEAEKLQSRLIYLLDSNKLSEYDMYYFSSVIAHVGKSYCKIKMILADQYPEFYFPEEYLKEKHRITSKSKREIYSIKVEDRKVFLDKLIKKLSAANVSYVLIGNEIHFGDYILTIYDNNDIILNPQIDEDSIIDNLQINIVSEEKTILDGMPTFDYVGVSTFETKNDNILKKSKRSIKQTNKKYSKVNSKGLR